MASLLATLLTIIGHHTWNYLLAWRDFVPIDRLRLRVPLRAYLAKEAQILIERHQDDGVSTELYLALNKRKVFKLFQDNGCF